MLCVAYPDRHVAMAVPQGGTYMRTNPTRYVPVSSIVYRRRRRSSSRTESHAPDLDDYAVDDDSFFQNPFLLVI